MAGNLMATSCEREASETGKEFGILYTRRQRCLFFNGGVGIATDNISKPKRLLKNMPSAL